MAKYVPEAETTGARKQSAQQDALPEHASGAQMAERDEDERSASLLDPGSLGGRGNMPVKAAVMHEMQQTYGNQKVQRYVQESSSDLAVQREPVATEVAGVGMADPSLKRPMLRQGMSGPVVEVLQQLLNRAGANPALDADGKFGPMTSKAVMAFQKAHGLSADGVVGRETWSALDNLFTTDPQVVPPAGDKTVIRSTAETAQQEIVQDMEFGSSAFKKGDFVTASRFFRRVYSLPEASEQFRRNALFNLAVCHEKLGQLEKAIELWQEYLVFPGVSDRAQVLERIRRARAQLAGVPVGQEIDPKKVTPQQRNAADEVASQEIEEGIQAATTGDFKGGLERFRTAYNMGAASLTVRVQAAIRMGGAHQRMSEFDKAIDMYQEALRFPARAFQPDDRLKFEQLQREDVLELLRQVRSGQSGKGAQSPEMTEEEQEVRLEKVRQDSRGGQYAIALEGLKELHALGNVPLERQRQIVYGMAFCNQRLLQFEEAISLYEQYLQYPGSDQNMQEVLEDLRQTRLGEVGSRVTPQPHDITFPPGVEQVVYKAEVFFDSGSANIMGTGRETITDLNDLINRKHSVEPELQFKIAIVGHASLRWITVSNTEEAHKLNALLSKDRGINVQNSMKTELIEPDPIYTFKVDASGDEEASKLGVAPNDNTWFFRSVTVGVSATKVPDNKDFVEVEQKRE